MYSEVLENKVTMKDYKLEDVSLMINITMPEVDIMITKKDNPEESNIYGFTEFHLIPRDKGGIFMFYNAKDELLFVGKARKLRPRVKRHFEDSVSLVKKYRNDITKIEVCIIKEPVDREIYETFIVNEKRAKYNIDKVFFKK